MIIKFVLVENKIELPDKYLPESIKNLVINKEVFKSIDCYHEKDNKAEFKIETKTKKIYFIVGEFHTHNDSKLLFIDIFPQKMENEFDKELHDLKFIIKKVFRKNWKQCIWLQDQQSNQLAQKLYLDIHLTENRLREFINLVMVRNFGPDWWLKYTTKKIRDKYKKRTGHYKGIANSYTDVSDHLLSIDTDDLWEIMSLKTYKFDPPSAVGDIGQIKEEYDRFINKLTENGKIEKDLWFNVFSRYFSDNFKDDWKEFSNNRNHIAHNKLIDFSANNKIIESIKKINDAITKAEDINKERFPSVEMIQESLEDMEIDEQYFEEDYMQSEIERIEAETGVNIRNRKEIFYFMQEQIISELNNIKEKFYFRNDLDMEIYELLEDQSTTLFEVSNRVTEDKIEIKAFTFINDDRGSESSIDLRVYNNKNEIFNGTLYYINGDGQIVENEAFYLPTIQDKIYFGGQEDFILNVVEKIEELFPNLVEKLIMKNNESIRDCGESIICESVCEDCGEETVCLDESIAPYGKCVNCGCENELTECLRCNNVYNSNFDGDSEFCEGCCTYIENHS